MAPVSACRPAVSGSVPVTQPAAAASAAASASAVASFGLSASVLATYHQHTPRQQQGKKTDHNPNRDPRPMLQRAHGREIHTFARFGGCAAATSFPAPASWSAGAGAGDELFPPSPSSSCCPAGRLAAALRLVSTISHRRGENTREGRGEAREGDAKRKQDETEGRGEENKTEGFVVLADGRRKNKIRPPPPPVAGQAADRSDWAVELSSIPRAQSGEAEQRINGGDIVQAFLMMGS
jgi:hypothetical protein